MPHILTTIIKAPCCITYRSKAVASAKFNRSSSEGRPTHNVATSSALPGSHRVLPDWIPYGRSLGPAERPYRQDLVYLEDCFQWCYLPVPSEKLQSRFGGEWEQSCNNSQSARYVGYTHSHRHSCHIAYYIVVKDSLLSNISPFNLTAFWNITE